MGSVYSPKDLSNKRKRKMVKNDSNDIIPNGNDQANEHDDIQGYDDRN